MAGQNKTNCVLSIESNPELICNCVTRLCDWLKKKNSRHTLNQSDKKLKQLLRHLARFPASRAGCVYLLRVVISSLCSLRFLLSVIAVALVSVCRHSSSNKCEGTYYAVCRLQPAAGKLGEVVLY